MPSKLLQIAYKCAPVDKIKSSRVGSGLIFAIRRFVCEIWLRRLLRHKISGNPGGPIQLISWTKVVKSEITPNYHNYYPQLIVFIIRPNTFATTPVFGLLHIKSNRRSCDGQNKSQFFEVFHFYQVNSKQKPGGGESSFRGTNLVVSTVIR